MINSDFLIHDRVEITTQLQNTYVNYYFPIKANSLNLHNEITIGLAGQDIK
jgi:hypothetical protein